MIKCSYSINNFNYSNKIKYTIHSSRIFILIVEIFPRVYIKFKITNHRIARRISLSFAQSSTEVASKEIENNYRQLKSEGLLSLRMKAFCRQSCMKLNKRGSQQADGLQMM